MNLPVFDLHCDTSFALMKADFCGQDSNLRKNGFHIDLERAGTLAGYAQCFACFTTTESDLPPVEVFERELAAIHREIERNKDIITQVYSAQEIEENRKNGIMSAILTIEGPAGFDFDPALLEDLYNVGFRMTTLGWNESNPLTGSNKTGGGLTDLGREYVKEAQRLGMIIDVSHISDEGFWDIVDITQAPIIASHSNSRMVCDCSRNLTDDMFRAVCDTGGVVGINQYAGFIGQTRDLDAVCKHVLHFLSMDPEGKHIALGADLDGCDELSAGFSGIQDYPRFADTLLRRGLSADMIKDIYWNNAFGVMKQCCI